MLIRHIALDEVIVPARADSINSPETDYALHKLPQGAKAGWTQQFDQVSKTIIQISLDNGITGLGESYRGISSSLLREIAVSLIGTDLRQVNLQALPIPSGRAYDGFECALLDAMTKSHDISLSEWLGGRYRDKVPCTYWTGHRTIDDAARKSREAVAKGYQHIKFKCKISDPVVDWCEAIQSACGEAFSVILDPNERFYSPAHTETIAHNLEEIGNVMFLEDPIPRWDFESWAYLRGKIRIPLSMHISLPYCEMGQIVQDAARAARIGASDYFNFNGGIYAFRNLAALSDLFGIPYSHGSEVDLGVLEASYVHKASAVAGATLPSDIFGRLIREHDLLKTPLQISNGEITVPDGPGLGIELDGEVLSHYTLEHWETPEQ